MPFSSLFSRFFFFSLPLFSLLLLLLLLLLYITTASFSFFSPSAAPPQHKVSPFVPRSIFRMMRLPKFYVHLCGCQKAPAQYFQALQQSNNTGRRMIPPLSVGSRGLVGVVPIPVPVPPIADLTLCGGKRSQRSTAVVVVIIAPCTDAVVVVPAWLCVCVRVCVCVCVCM